jgi:serine/threonine protein kinase
MVESKYKKGELLGRGAFGMVYKCTRISDDKQLAMKEINFTYENR